MLGERANQRKLNMKHHPEHKGSERKTIFTPPNSSDNTTIYLGQRRAEEFPMKRTLIRRKLNRSATMATTKVLQTSRALMTSKNLTTTKIPHNLLRRISDHATTCSKSTVLSFEKYTFDQWNQFGSRELSLSSRQVQVASLTGRTPPV
jgi:hypothetical protein